MEGKRLKRGARSFTVTSRIKIQSLTHRLLLEIPERVLLGDGGDLAHGVHGEVLGEGLAAEEAQAVHGVPLRQLEQRDGALRERKKEKYSFCSSALSSGILRARSVYIGRVNSSHALELWTPEWKWKVECSQKVVDLVDDCLTRFNLRLF